MENPFKNLFKKKPKDNLEDIKHEPEKKKKNFFSDLLKNKLGKSAVQGEEIVGVELTTNEIRLAQLTSNKSNQWILEKFYTHKFGDADDESTVLANPDKVAEELKLALQKFKINTTNAAIAIPVTSAIIRVVTAPLMTEEELLNAIQTDSLWENLVQLTDNLDDYSIFHQIISKNDKANTMDILFVASKLSDINSYTDIVKKGGLNVVIIDVKCFALKSAVDQINHVSGSIEESNLTTILEFGLDENYVMILHENNPIITDIFIRSQDRKTLKESNNKEEMDALVKRYLTQVKQAVQDFETRYEKRIRNIKVTSDLPNVEEYLATFRTSMVNTGFDLFDPLNGIKVPAQFEESVNFKNRSYFSSVIGLAFRKLDVFGYFKFVTAVKSINLLPNRSNMLAKKKAKIFSNYAFKGITALVSIIYVVLFGMAFWQINSLNKKIENYDQVEKEHILKKKELDIVSKEYTLYKKSLDLGKSIKSNKKLSFRMLAQIASAVPKRVKFKSIKYEANKNSVLIEGSAYSDKDILKLISNLSAKKLIMQATLTSMTLPNSSQNSGQVMKGFKIICKLKRT